MYCLTEEDIEKTLEIIRPYNLSDEAFGENRKIIFALFDRFKIDDSAGLKKWDDIQAKWLINSMTAFQKRIISYLINGEASMGNVIKDLQTISPNANGVSLGGACAGLHRKCNQRKLPHLVKWRQDELGFWFYFLEPKAFPFISKGII